MVRRRSTVRFRNGAPLKDQVRSSLDSSHPTQRMGAVAVLGGIWEIVFCGPAELKRQMYGCARFDLLRKRVLLA